MATKLGKLTYTITVAAESFRRFSGSMERARIAVERAFREVRDAEHQSTWWRGGEPFDDEAWRDAGSDHADQTDRDLSDDTVLECFAEGDTTLEG